MLFVFYAISIFFTPLYILSPARPKSLIDIFCGMPPIVHCREWLLALIMHYCNPHQLDVMMLQGTRCQCHSLKHRGPLIHTHMEVTVQGPLTTSNLLDQFLNTWGPSKGLVQLPSMPVLTSSVKFYIRMGGSGGRWGQNASNWLVVWIQREVKVQCFGLKRSTGLSELISILWILETSKIHADMLPHQRIVSEAMQG